MNRKAASEFATPMFVAFSVMILVWGLVLVATSDFDKYENPQIGSKQEAVFHAEQQRQAITNYASIAARQALKEVEESGDPTTGYEEKALAAFHRRMAQYPDPQPPVFEMTMKDGEAVFSTTEELSVPIVSADERVFTYAGGGVFTTWPVDGPMRVVSLFGKRDSVGSENHAGIDIGVSEPPFINAAGEDIRLGWPVKAVQAGTATSFDEGVQLRTTSGWVCEYLHVGATFTGSKEVSEGEVIAEVIDDGYVPHVDLRCYNPDVLTAGTAEATFTSAHVGTAKDPPPDTAYSVTKDERAYIDTYCLFTEDIRLQLQISDDITGFDSRAGADKQEKLLETCNAYSESSILAITKTDSEPSDTGPYHTTLENLNTVKHDGEPLMELVRRIADEEEVEEALVIAMIAAESQGEVNARSDTGVRGLMQVTCATARAVVQFDDCDELYGPELNVRAGTRYFKSILERWEGYTHRVAFGAAEYNGGSILKDLAGEAPGRSYEDAMEDLTPPYLVDKAPDVYGSWTPAQRLAKVDEISGHGRKVAAYYELGGGSSPPLSHSRNRVGTYSFSVRVTARADTDKVRTLEALKDRLAICENYGCIQGHLDNPVLAQDYENISRCTPYVDTVERTVTQCAPNMVDGCSCEIPRPAQGEALFEPDKVRQLDSQGYPDWFMQGDEEFTPVSYVMAGEVGQALRWVGEQLHVGSLIATGQFGDVAATTEPGTSFFASIHPIRTADHYYVGIREDNSSAVCPARVHERYCLDDVSFWVEHRFQFNGTIPGSADPLAAAGLGSGS